MACKSRRRYKKRSKSRTRVISKRKRGRRRRRPIYFGGGNNEDQESSCVCIAGSALKKSKIHFAGKNLRHQLPLLKVLRDIKPEQRTIILAHLDNQGCSTVINSVKKVLHNKKLNNHTRKKLIKTLSSQKNLFRKLISSKKGKDRKQLLPAVGSGLGLVLGTAIPLLLELARRKKWI